MGRISSLGEQISGPASRLAAAAQNAFEVARFGGLETDEEPSPFDVVSQQRTYRLRHYFAGEAAGPAILLVPPQLGRGGHAALAAARRGTYTARHAHTHHHPLLHSDPGRAGRRAERERP